MAKKKQSAYSKELRRITRRIKDIEKRGYIVPSSFKEEIKSYSWQKLRTIKPRFIYSISHYISKDTGIVSGLQGRQIERQASIARQKETLRRKRITDTEEIAREGDIIYDKIVGLIDKFSTDGKIFLEDMLKYEIKRYGKDAVVRSLAKAPQTLLDNIEAEIYYERDKSSHHKSLKALADLIKGTIETEAEAKEIGQIQDAITTYENPQ